MLSWLRDFFDNGSSAARSIEKKFCILSLSMIQVLGNTSIIPDGPSSGSSVCLMNGSVISRSGAGAEDGDLLI